MTGDRDERLGTMFDQLKAEDRSGTPSFDQVLARARVAAAPAARPPRRRLWKAVPAGALLAAAGISAIAFFGSPSPAEADFRQAVAWLGSDPLFGSMRTPSDVLLKTPEWSLLKSGPLSGLSDALSSPARAALELPSERNES